MAEKLLIVEDEETLRESLKRVFVREGYEVDVAPDAESALKTLEGKALPDTKNVVGTNVIEIAWRLDPRTGRLVILSAEDNLVKGASGQAVQSMNLMCGFRETAGLV